MSTVASVLRDVTGVGRTQGGGMERNRFFGRGPFVVLNNRWRIGEGEVKRAEAKTSISHWLLFRLGHQPRIIDIHYISPSQIWPNDGKNFGQFHL